MLISFVLMADKIKVSDIKSISRRVHKLYFPHLCWAIIYWGIHQICRLAAYKDMNALGWQLLGGHSRKLNPPMWFQISLIVLTILFWIIYIFFNKVNCVMLTILFGSLFLQYSGLNYNLFANYIYEIKYPLGRIVEMLPYACLGIGLREYKVFEKVKLNMKVTQIILILFCILSMACDLIYKPMGFGYQGMRWIAFSLFIVVNFYIISFDKINMKIIKMAAFISRYSLGIYCMHFIVGQITNSVFTKIGWKTGTIGECILIYLFCLIFSIIIAKIPLKWCKDIVCNC